LIDDGVLYVGTENNRMYAFNADNGQSIWAQPFQARDGEKLLVTPAVVGQTLIALPNLAGGDPVRLYGLNKNTGALLWRYPPQKTQ
jgi:outer membrane protein assembly factor BamB